METENIKRIENRINIHLEQISNLRSYLQQFYNRIKKESSSTTNQKQKDKIQSIINEKFSQLAKNIEEVQKVIDKKLMLISKQLVTIKLEKQQSSIHMSKNKLNFKQSQVKLNLSPLLTEVNVDIPTSRMKINQLLNYPSQNKIQAEKYSKQYDEYYQQQQRINPVYNNRHYNKNQREIDYSRRQNSVKYDDNQMLQSIGKNHRYEFLIQNLLDN